MGYQRKSGETRITIASGQSVARVGQKPDQEIKD